MGVRRCGRSRDSRRQKRRARFKQGLVEIETVADAPSVAVADQDDETRARGIRRGREKPAVQFHRVA